MNSDLDAVLDQRGRASMDFLAHMARGGRKLRETTNAQIAEVAADPASLPDDLDQRHARLVQSLSGSRQWRASQLLEEWGARMHGRIATEAFEEIFPRLEPVIARYQSDGPATLEAAGSGDIPPGYWEGVNFHRTHGGWEDHVFQGYIHGEIVHRKLVDRLFPGGGIFKQRRAVAEMAPKDHYDRILDMGASTGHFTMALQMAYPEAEITGVDLSLRTLEHAQRVANANGWAWKLYQRPAEQTGFEDDSFDLVASYILLHEIPADTIRGVLAEAYRVLKPGGDMIMSDVTRYAALDKLAEWKADTAARYGGEPHWRESARLDIAEVAREAGFTDVEIVCEPPMNYPYIVKGRKAP